MFINKIGGGEMKKTSHVPDKLEIIIQTLADYLKLNEADKAKTEGFVLGLMARKNSSNEQRAGKR